MMRILFILPDVRGGGAERVILRIIRNLDSSKFKPVLFLIKPEGEYWGEIPENIEIHYAIEAGNSIGKNILAIFKKLLLLAKRSDVIVSGLELTATYFASLVGILTRRSVIGWVHTDLTRYPTARKLTHAVLIQLCYPLLTKVVVVSEGVATSTQKLIPLIKKKLCVINNPIEIHDILVKADVSPEIKYRKRTILSVGRLSNEKGFDVLIKTHALLINSGIEQDLVILGDGPDRQQLERLAIDLGVTDSVFFKGFDLNPYRWMKNADVFVLCSRFEGLGMVILEAMALAKPIIATNCPGGGPKEVIGEDEYGLLAKSDDTLDIAEKLKNLIDNENLVEAMGQKAYQRALHFDCSVIIPKFEQLLESMVKSK